MPSACAGKEFRIVSFFLVSSFILSFLFLSFSLSFFSFSSCLVHVSYVTLNPHFFPSLVSISLLARLLTLSLRSLLHFFFVTAGQLRSDSQCIRSTNFFFLSFFFYYDSCIPSLGLGLPYFFELSFLGISRKKVLDAGRQTQVTKKKIREGTRKKAEIPKTATFFYPPSI